MSTDLALSRVHGSLNRNRTGKVAGIGAKEAGEVAEIADGSGNIALEIGIQPVERLARKSRFAAQGELVLALLHIKLLDRNFSVVEGGAEHDYIRCAIPPG